VGQRTQELDMPSSVDSHRLKSAPKGAFPTQKCVVCQAPTQGYRQLSHDSQGNVQVMAVDIWPEYFRDWAQTRVEFCSAACSLTFVQKQSPSN
jgi:hypothetical protein